MAESGDIDRLARIERLLALQLLHDLQDASQSAKAVTLNRAGFTNSEIAGLLGTSTAVVGQQLYTARSGKKKAASSRANKNKSENANQ